MLNFDDIPHRNNTFSEKWDLRKEVFGTEEVVPLWVADMDFRCADEILAAITERTKQGVLGYTYPPAELFHAIQYWQETRNQWQIEKENLIVNNTVISSLNALLRVLSQKEDYIMMCTPVYFPFFHTVNKLNRKNLFSKLVLSNNNYTMDWEDIEQKMQQYQPKVFLLCNPHNPSGRVWKKEELAKLAQLCQQYNVDIISDDIHSDILFQKGSYTPAAVAYPEYRNHIHTLSAPTKAFNFAGLKSSFAIIFNEKIRQDFQLKQQELGYHKLNIFAIEATIAAYQHCEYWLDRLNLYLKDHYAWVMSEMKGTSLELIQSDSTFLIWVKYANSACSEQDIFNNFIKHGLGVQMGSQFGPGGEGFFRVNIGTGRPLLKQPIQTLKKLFSY
ncbi:MalY/PatB family protein [Bacillus chungangensis]|uniref:cysteine-S-conjugate beta-lyase n=1 Tax=Bacillus chungangensis TaxID=587633 RepID=A0ABT9WXV1_9BACI|nr:PatB family C-S lyase [Bacillus chungangensis]MDQ0177949.1 cystathionine beta-lyase [Bacillus chungangensis]